MYTLLIWTLLLVLLLSTLSRASEPGIGMNSILRTCMFINSCVALVALEIICTCLSQFPIYVLWEIY